MTYEEAVHFIENTPKFLSDGKGRNKSGNDNLIKVMKYLDNPQYKVKSVHIAGTNGKGSTARFATDVLCAMGYKVGLFTSPHLVKVNERISLNYFLGHQLKVEDISDEDFLKYFNRVMSAVEKNNQNKGSYLSYFEMLFAIATLFFSEKKLDYVVYETGLGGRLDATNILKPEATAITSIGLDHTAYLGNTIEEIAMEKAGIIKKGIPIVYNTGSKIADEVIKQRADDLQCPSINVANVNYIANEITDKTIDFSMTTGYYKYHNIILNVSGAKYQMDNAACAIVLCNCLFENNPIPEECVKKAATSFFWSGRMERIGKYIIIDGAHNEDAVLRYIEAVKCIKDMPVSMLFAVSADKDYEPMIKLLSEKLQLKRVYVTSLDSDRSIKAEKVAKIFEKYNQTTQIYFDDCIKDILYMGYEETKKEDDILFCVGSLYLVGSIKEIALEGNFND